MFSLLPVIAGLAAALSWGTADFAGGLGSRRAAAVRVVLASQVVGTIGLVALGLFLAEPRPANRDLFMGAVAGLAGGLGLLLLYLSLARGKMGLAAPLTAVASGGIPLVAGLLTEGLPGTYQILGFLVALVSIWIISRPEGEEPIKLGDIGLPLLSGVGFGVFLALIGLVGEEAGFVWPLLAARASSITVMTAMALAGWQLAGNRHAGAERFPWLLAGLAGAGDTVGNAFYMVSASAGRLDVAAVLGALYPAATVLLARVVLAERLSSRQNVGVALALAAVVLIAL